MGIHLRGKKPGDLFIGEDGSVHRLDSFFDGPSATIEEIGTGARQTGGIGSLNFEPYKQIADCSQEELIGALEHLSQFVYELQRERLDQDYQIELEENNP